MVLHHAIITLKTDRIESGSVDQLIAKIHQLTHETKMRCINAGLHAEVFNGTSLRIYGTTQQIGDLIESLLEKNILSALRIHQLEKIPYAETGSGD